MNRLIVASVFSMVSVVAMAQTNKVCITAGTGSPTLHVFPKNGSSASIKPGAGECFSTSPSPKGGFGGLQIKVKCSSDYMPMIYTLVYVTNVKQSGVSAYCLSKQNANSFLPILNYSASVRADEFNGKRPFAKGIVSSCTPWLVSEAGELSITIQKKGGGACIK